MARPHSEIREAILAAIRTGDTYGPAIRQRVDAGWLRDIIATAPRSGRGIALENVEFIERLDLSCMVPDGGTVPPLAFKKCVFADGIDGRHSRFASLALFDCVFGDKRVGRESAHLTLTGATCDGRLSLERCRPQGPDKFVCCLNEMRIAGTCRIVACELREADGNGGLVVQRTRIEGGLYVSASHISGCVRFDNITIGGNLEVRDCTFIETVAHAGCLFLTAVSVEGYFKLLQEEEVEGGLGGLLQISGANFAHGATIDCRGAQPNDALPIIIERVHVKGEMHIGTHDDTAVMSLRYLEICNSQFEKLSLAGLRFRSDGALKVFDCRSGVFLINRSGSATSSSSEPRQSGFLALASTQTWLVRLKCDAMTVTESAFRGAFEMHNCVIANSVFLGLKASALACVDCRVGGSLNLFGFSIPVIEDISAMLEPAHLNLRGTTIGQSLIVSQDMSLRPHDPPTLKKARQRSLESLPGTVLIETLWQPGDEIQFFEGAEAAKRFEIAFLWRNNDIVKLNGESATFHDYVNKYGASVRSTDNAIEFTRLFCRFVYGDAGPFWPVRLGEDSKPELPFVEDPLLGIREREYVFERGSEEDFRDFTAQSAGNGFAVQGQIAYEKGIFQARFSLEPPRPDHHEFTIELADDEPIAIFDQGMPKFKDEQVFAFDDDGYWVSDDWITPGIYPDMQPVPDQRRAELQLLLQPLAKVRFAPGATIDLRNASCDTLQDEDGLAWGRPAIIRLNHFEYNRVGVRPAGRDTGDKLASSFAETVKIWLLRSFSSSKRLLGRSSAERAKRRGEYGARGWRSRFYWLMRQFPDLEDFGSPDAYRLSDPDDYRPQPFAQAIKVARAEGRYTDATQLAIAKRRLEWRMFSDKWSRHFGLMGASLCAVTAGFASGDILDITFAAIVGGTLGYYGSSATSAFLRKGFGYTHQAFGAVVTLIATFLMGWAGVSIANHRGLLTLELMPVASAARTGKGHVEFGTPYTNATVESETSCQGLIREPLYALDILIPIIDLKEEAKCAVGRSVQAKATTGSGVVAAIDRRTLNSADFWAIAKTLYALLGWIVISLSILTFTNVTRGSE